MDNKKNLISIFLDTVNRKEYIKFGDNKEIKESIIGTFLTDFINCNFNDPSSISMFTGKYIYLLDTLDTGDYIDANKLELIRTDFISTIDYVFNIYNLEEVRQFTAFERYYTLTKSRLESDITKYSYNLNMNFNIDINLEQMKYCTSSKEKYVLEQIEKSKLIPCPYFVSSTDISNILYISFKELLTILDFPIKKCQNCGKYFVPLNRTDEVYCNNIYEDNKTCKEIGFSSVRKRRFQEDDIARLYRNTYQQKLLRAKRNPNNTEYQLDLEKFRQEYKVIKQDMKDDKKTDEDFKKWLLSVKRNIR